MKSKKLEREQAEARRQSTEGLNAAFADTPGFIKGSGQQTELKIKPVKCLNEFIAIMEMVTAISEVIHTPDAVTEQCEGVVIGVGPGLPNANGRCASQLEIGDTVLFLRRNISATVEPRTGPYADKKIVFIQERSLLSKLNPVEHTIVSE